MARPKNKEKRFYPPGYKYPPGHSGRGNPPKTWNGQPWPPPDVIDAYIRSEEEKRKKRYNFLSTEPTETQTPLDLTEEGKRVHALWEAGNLEYKLLPHQVALYHAIKKALVDPACMRYVVKCARRFGKSTVLSLIAIEFACLHPGAQILFVAPTAKALRKAIHPAFRLISRDAPADYRPEFISTEGAYRFPNGSWIHLAGTDKQMYENLRGLNSHLNIIDEAGFCDGDDLTYILQDILIPQTLTTGGKSILSSTPPRSIAHDFTSIALDCEVKGYFQKFTVYDNSSISPERIEMFASESGGASSTTFRREYLCEDVTDSEYQIIPEWDDKYIGEPTRNENWPFLHRYVAMDIGVRDLTALLFAVYNFEDATLYVLGEADVHGAHMTTQLVKEIVTKKEAELFENVIPYRRIADNNNLILLQDLSYLHGISFSPTSKDNLHAMVNELRVMVNNGRVRISARCIKLLATLRSGVWADDKRNNFSRLKGLGHCDYLASLIYLIRNLDQNSNPIPVSNRFSTPDRFIRNPVLPGTVENTTAEVMKNIFNPNRFTPNRS